MSDLKNNKTQKGNEHKVFIKSSNSQHQFLKISRHVVTHTFREQMEIQFDQVAKELFLGRLCSQSTVSSVSASLLLALSPAPCTQLTPHLSLRKLSFSAPAPSPLHCSFGRRYCPHSLRMKPASYALLYCHIKERSTFSTLALALTQDGSTQTTIFAFVP